MHRTISVCFKSNIKFKEIYSIADSASRPHITEDMQEMCKRSAENKQVSEGRLGKRSIIKGDTLI